jgi:hypothetical protein
MDSGELSIIDPAPLHPGGRLRAVVLVLVGMTAAVAILVAVSYFTASRLASATALSRVPDLGRVEANLGFHALGNGDAQPLTWEFSYGPSGEGPIMFQVYVDLTGHLVYTEPPTGGAQPAPPAQ